MQSIWNMRHVPWVVRFVLTTMIVVGVLVIATATLVAQEEEIAVGIRVNAWSDQRTIPGYHPETEPPVLMVDQSGTIHAVSSQWLGEEGKPLKAIMYNQWAPDSGWTMPGDVLLSPLKDQARLLDAFLDESGRIHVVFFGGNAEDANIYYSNAPASEGGRAGAWLNPVLVGPMAHDPERGSIASDGSGNLVVLFSGDRYGTGWYVVTSSDNGNIWSEANLFFPSYHPKHSPFYLRTYLGESGLLHAVWSVNDQDNHGLAIYYANFDFDTMHWSEPLQLAEPISAGEAGNLGTQVPNIIEYQDALYVAYYDGSTGRQYFLASEDNGRSWTEPVVRFPHVGLNGVTDFIVDSNDNLHFFWAQRMNVSREFGFVNGLWHSTWQETGWSDFEAVVTGRKLVDKVGFNAFDPNTVHVAISEGNKVLVTWRTDRGSRGNGVWYSSAVLDAPPLQVSPLPTAPSALVVDDAGEILAGTPEPTAEAVPEFGDQLDIQNMAGSNPTEGLLTSLVPVTLLVLLIGIFYQISHSRQR